MRLRPSLLTGLALGVLGCPTDEPPPPDPPADGPCQDATPEGASPPCLHRVADGAAWEALSVPGGGVGVLRATKFLAPARADARLPTLYLDAHQHVLHFDLLVGPFGETFGSMSPGDYLRMIFEPTREFYAGTVSEYVLEDDSSLFGFTTWEDPTDPASFLELHHVEAAWDELSSTFALRPLAWVPSSERQRAEAAGWDAPFPIHGLDDGVDYEPYTIATGYGTLRLVPIDELADAIAGAEFGFQDIVVLEDAPVDVERVVSGAVTGGRQSELSHLNVRSAARGTPNCFVRDPFTELAEWEDRLVRLTCGEDALEISETTPEQAQAFWDALQPDPVPVPTPDVAPAPLAKLLELPTDTPQERAEGLARYGSKGASLAALYQRIDPELQLTGFLVPFHHQDRFMQDTTWVWQEQELTFAETIEAWTADPQFQQDAALRRDRLEALRGAMRQAPVDEDLLADLAAAIQDVWGTDLQMVRFRSSSNAEDSLRFSGAGLYDSTSACLADELDDDDDGPSRCDPDQPDERTLTRALTRVWASLWAMSAWEERAWYGIPPDRVAMGVLVNTRSKDEQANLVAFTGNPVVVGDDRYVVNAQLGELSVVSPAPGEQTELTRLTVEGGQVVAIDRVRASSETGPGENVLDDARLEALGAALAQFVAVFPVDEGPPADGDVLLDTEWKVLSDGRLICKQARPFLRLEP